MAVDTAVAAALVEADRNQAAAAAADTLHILAAAAAWEAAGHTHIAVHIHHNYHFVAEDASPSHPVALVVAS